VEIHSGFVIRRGMMRLVAIYRSDTGKITALCALPADKNAPSVGMQMAHGESRAEFEMPEELMLKHDDPQVHARMENIIENYRIEQPGEARLIKYSPANPHS
jgi:hypothetical protein